MYTHIHIYMYIHIYPLLGIKPRPFTSSNLNTIPVTIQPLWGHKSTDGLCHIFVGYQSFHVLIFFLSSLDSWITTLSSFTYTNLKIITVNPGSAWLSYHIWPIAMLFNMTRKQATMLVSLTLHLWSLISTGTSAVLCDSNINVSPVSSFSQSQKWIPQTSNTHLSSLGEDLIVSSLSKSNQSEWSFSPSCLISPHGRICMYPE